MSVHVHDLAAGHGVRRHRGPVQGSAVLKGEQDQVAAHGEPTGEDAARLLHRIASMGTVDRLDAVQGALVAAYRAGRHTEQQDVAQLAQQHAGAFLAAVVARGTS